MLQHHITEPDSPQAGRIDFHLRQSQNEQTLLNFLAVNSDETN